MTADPDGTVYVLGLQGNAWVIDGIDVTGRELSGWPATVPGSAVPSLVVVPGQGVLALSGSVLTWIDRAGAARPGWPVRLGPGAVGPWLDPSGIVLVAVPGGQGSMQIQAYDVSGRSSWSVVLSGAQVDQVAFGADGAAFVSTRDASGSRIYRLGGNGSISPGWPIVGWPAWAASPSGAVVVWAYRGPGGVAVDTTVATTTVALIGVDGKPLAGWPLMVDGPASAPAVSPDGTVYLSRGDGQSASGGSVVAFDVTGKPIPGWPVALEGMGLSMVTTVHQPAVTTAPIVRADGVVELQVATTAGDELVALEPSGSPAPGFPVALGHGVGFAPFGDAVPGQPPAPLLLTSTGVTVALESDGTVFQIAAFDATGQPLPGPAKAMLAEDLPLAWALTANAVVVETTNPYVQPEVGRLYGVPISP